jgi:hypothetical protein
MQTGEQALEWFRNIVSNLYQRMLDRAIEPKDIDKVMEEIIHEHSTDT